MKIHVGVDATTGYVHTITATAANVYDSQEMSKLVRGNDEVVYGFRILGRKEARENILMYERAKRTLNPMMG